MSPQLNQLASIFHSFSTRLLSFSYVLGLKLHTGHKPKAGFLASKKRFQRGYFLSLTTSANCQAFITLEPSSALTSYASLA